MSTEYTGTANRERNEGFFYPRLMRRVSWGAIFAGAIVALVVQLALTLLGLGIGLGITSPAEGAPSAGTIGVSAGIWFAITTIISLFLGGWVAGRMAGFPRRMTTALHGIVVWGLVTLFTFYLMNTAIGSVLGGVTSTIGKSLSTLASSGQVSQQGIKQFAQKGGALANIMNQADQLIRNNAVPGPQAGSEGIGQQAQTDQGVQEMRQAIAQLFANGGKNITPQKRQAVVNVIVNYTNIPRAKAQGIVNDWIRQYNSPQALGPQAGIDQETLARAAGQVSDTLSKAALWAFLALVLGAIAAAVGGAAGRPDDALSASGEISSER